tara:strand:- start:915 stop:1211 length:297 start_codon:yes stop_codon:yes gene_type:complete
MEVLENPANALSSNVNDLRRFLPSVCTAFKINISAERRPPMIFNNVDLPQPDGPIKATISPFVMLISTPLSTSNLFEPEPKLLVKSFTVSMILPLIYT